MKSIIKLIVHCQKRSVCYCSFLQRRFLFPAVRWLQTLKIRSTQACDASAASKSCANGVSDGNADVEFQNARLSCPTLSVGG